MHDGTISRSATRHPLVDEVTTEEGAHTTAFDSQRGRLYVFMPKSIQVAVYEEAASGLLSTILIRPHERLPYA